MCIYTETETLGPIIQHKHGKICNEFNRNPNRLRYIFRLTDELSINTNTPN